MEISKLDKESSLDSSVKSLKPTDAPAPKQSTKFRDKHELIRKLSIKLEQAVLK